MIPRAVWTTRHPETGPGKTRSGQAKDRSVCADGAWAAAFLAAAVVGMQSEVPSSATDICLLLGVVFSRPVLASFGVVLPIFDVPAAMCVALHAIATLIRVHLEKS